MGVMTRELKKLRGKQGYVAAQRNMDKYSEAQQARVIENDNNGYLKQLHYGMEQLLTRVMDQEMMIKELVQQLKRDGVKKVMIEPKRGKKPYRVVYKKNNERDVNKVALRDAINLINENKDRNGRITWRNVSNPKDLVFAYIRKAESEGLDIHSTMVMQDIPEYRRAFQYVAYNIGAWRDVIQEYRYVYR